MTTEETYIDSDGSRLIVKRGLHTTRYFNSKGLIHRLDGPAVECPGTFREWYQDGRFHHLNGPAVEWEDGYKEWWVEGKKVEPLFLVSHWLERGRCCWFDESTQSLCFADP